MSTQKNLITLCFAAVFALGLAACSSNGDDAPQMSMPDTDMDGDGDAKTPADILADARAALAALPDDATDDAKEMAQKSGR